MSALQTPRPHFGQDRAATRPSRRPAAPPRPVKEPHPRPQLSRRLAIAALLLASGFSLLLSVPGLRPVLDEMRDVNPFWIVLAVGLELASCVSFVILFRAFFDRLPGRDARPLAWANMASGALLPGGGAGGMAIGGWLTHLTGASTRWIVRRSGGLFFLTTAVNAATVIGGGALLAAGVSRPNGFALAALPALVVAVATSSVLIATRAIRRQPRSSRWVNVLAEGVHEAQITTFQHPTWRLLGSLGYLGFDIAVLWVTLAAVGEQFSVPALLLAYNIGYVANSLPVPGGFGVLDAGLAGALMLYGARPAHAAAAVLLYHAIAFWIPGLGGVLAYPRLRRRLTIPAAPGASRVGIPSAASGDTA